MKVRIFASQEVKHVENSLGSVLISAALAEVTDDPVTYTPLPKPGQFVPPEPKWLVALHPRTNVHIIQMVLLNQFYYFSDDPADANRTETRNGRTRWTNGFNRAIPKNILDEYTRRWKSQPQHRDVPEFVSAANPNRCEENEEQAKEKKRFDDAVASGSVPRTGSKSNVIG
jgi:hypothetical protein